jgi:selenocysteine-specific elongation factor
VRLSAAEQRMAERIVPRMARDGFEGSWVRDLARDGGEPEIHVRVTLARLARRGELHQVVKDLYYPPPAMARLAAIARDTGRSGEVTAAAFRDATGLGRKRAIQILEYLDRIGVLRRVGDVHKVRTDATVFTEAQR